MEKFHAQDTIISHDGSKGLEPLHAQDHVGTTPGQDMEVHDKLITLDSDGDCFTEVVTVKVLAIPDHDT